MRRLEVSKIGYLPNSESSHNSADQHACEIVCSSLHRTSPESDDHSELVNTSQICLSIRYYGRFTCTVRMRPNLSFVLRTSFSPRTYREDWSALAIPQLLRQRSSPLPSVYISIVAHNDCSRRYGASPVNVDTTAPDRLS